MTFACILMNFTYIYFQLVVVKYNYNKIKEHVHIKHCPK
jgi:hypothetical protein